jgi:hypothetical protein
MNLRQCFVQFNQNEDKNRDIEIGKRQYENLSQFKYSRTTVTNHNFIQEEIKCRLNSGNSSLHSVQNILSSCHLSKNINILI